MIVSSLILLIYAAVNGHLELPLLKDRQRFDAVSTSNLEVWKFRDLWILTYFIFWHGESSPNNFWSMVNLERTCDLLFYYFLCLKANLDLEKTNQLGESSPNFIFSVVNLDLIILEKRWIDGESWPDDFDEKVNRGEDLRWVGSRWSLTHALGKSSFSNKSEFDIKCTLFCMLNQLRKSYLKSFRRLDKINTQCHSRYRVLSWEKLRKNSRWKLCTLSFCRSWYYRSQCMYWIQLKVIYFGAFGFKFHIWWNESKIG